MAVHRSTFKRTPERVSVTGDTRRHTSAGRSLLHVQTVADSSVALPPSGADRVASATTVSVIVPATDAPETLFRCCDALVANDNPPDEIVIIDGPSSANAATARNLGAERATGDILCFVDADVEVRADTVTRIREAFDADPSLAAVFGSYDDLPSAPGVTSRFRNLLHHQVHQTARGPATTFWTGLGAIRRVAFLQVGGFDESVEFMEDVDLGIRMHAAGLMIVLDPSIQGTHLKRWTVWSMIRTDVVGRGVPWIRILLRHRSTSSALNLSWRHRLSVLASVTMPIGLALLQPLVVLGALAILVMMNWRFYALLVRRRGPIEASAGVVLHVLHYLACAVSIPIGVALYLGDERRSRRTLHADEPTGVETPVTSPT